MSLAFTGERFIPTEQGELAYEHWHRYAWAREFVRGKTVLDIACGEGYGSSLLAQWAQRVVGMDIDPATVAHARAQYQRPNLSFTPGSVTATGLAEASIDVVISFETLEHIDQHEQMLQELKRVLKPGGILIISTPDKAVYTDQRPGYHNEYHVKELYRAEFDALLSRHFAYHQMFGQQIATASFVLPEHQNTSNATTNYAQAYQAHTQQGQQIDHHVVSARDPMYLLAICAQDQAILQQAIQAAQFTASVYVDAQEGLTNQREEAVRWARTLEQELKQAQTEVGRLQTEHEHTVHWAQELDRTVQQSRLEVQRLQDIHESTVQWAQSLEQDVERGRAQLQHQEQHIQLQSAQLRESATRVDEQNQQIAQAQHQLDLLYTQRNIQQDQITQLQQEISGLLNSNSWRITRPLRFGMRLLRGDWQGVKQGLRLRGRPVVAGMYKLLPNVVQRFARNAFFAVFPNRLHGSFAYQQWLTDHRDQMIQPAVVPVAAEQVAQKIEEQFARLAQEQSCADPLVTVVIPTYGNLSYSLNCIASLFEHKPRTPFAVLVVEDCSGDADIQRLSELSCIRFENHPTNLGFVRSCNRAVQMVQTKYVHLLNNDTVVTPGWLDALVNLMENRSDCGLVGSKLIYPDGRLQEAGGIVWDDASAWNFGRLDDPQKSIYNYVKPVDYVSGASIMMRTQDWNRLGGFDEHYVPAYCEDSDLAFRVRQAGMMVLYQPASTVVHFEGISNGTDTGSGIKAYQVTNQQKFVQRWSHVLKAKHFANAQEVFLARDRSRNKPCILVVDHYIPQPDKDAGSRTMLLYLQTLVRMGWNVKFWPDNLFADKPYMPALEQLGIEIMYGAEFADGIGPWLQTNSKHVQAVLLSRPHITVKYLDVFKRYPHIRTLYYGHDIHFLRLQDQVNQGVQNAATPVQIDQMREQEEHIWQRVDVVLYPSDDETAHIQQWARERNLAVHADTIAPYAFEQTVQVLQPDQRADLLFVGGFGHAPNVDGIVWFCQSIMPLLLANKPGLKLYVVGSNAPEQVKRLASDNVKVLGFISDDELQALYERCKLVVAPLRYGGGVKGKVIEAFRWGVPVVTTQAGVQGLSDYKDSLLVDNDPVQFASLVLKCLDDPQLWQQTSQAQLRVIHERFDLSALEHTFTRWLRSAPTTATIPATTKQAA